VAALRCYLRYRNDQVRKVLHRIWGVSISTWSILPLIGFIFTACATSNHIRDVPSARVHGNQAICFGCSLRSYFVLFPGKKIVLSPYAIKIIAMAASYGKSRNEGITIDGFSNSSRDQNKSRQVSLKLVNLVRHQLVLDGAPTTKMVLEGRGSQGFVFPKNIQARGDLHNYVVISVN
jgi:hypothetical protein